MKVKIFASVFGALLLVIGVAWGASAFLGASTSSLSPLAKVTATATSTVTNYPGSVGTVCEATLTNGGGASKVAYSWSVTTTNGSGAPASGTFAFEVKKGTTSLFTSTASSVSGDTGNSGSGSYSATGSYTPANGNSVYRPCTVTETFTR